MSAQRGFRNGVARNSPGRAVGFCEVACFGVTAFHVVQPDTELSVDYDHRAAAFAILAVRSIVRDTIGVNDVGLDAAQLMAALIVVVMALQIRSTRLSISNRIRSVPTSQALASHADTVFMHADDDPLDPHAARGIDRIASKVFAGAADLLVDADTSLYAGGNHNKARQGLRLRIVEIVLITVASG